VINRIIVVSTGLITLLSANAFACGNLSGAYIQKFDDSDYRQELKYKISQKGCETITFYGWELVLRNGQVIDTDLNTSRTDITDGAARSSDGVDVSASWKGNSLEYIMKQTLNGECFDHQIWSKNADGSLAIARDTKCP
jgi:hypothetical protein